MYVSFHVQNSPSRWLDAIARLPDGAPVKLVMGAERGREVKAINEKLVTWYRWVAPDQNLAAGNYEAQARAYFERYIDGTFLSGAVAPYIDIVQEPFNEYHNNGHTPAERQHWQNWTAACARVWDDYRSKYQQLRDMRLVLGGAGVGNDLTLEDAKIAVAYDCLLDSHSYTPVANGVIMPDSGTHPDGREINGWKYYEGRFSYMDEYFVANGYRVDWALGEGGPVRDASPWWGNLQPQDGWNHKDCCNKSIDCYLRVIKHWMDNALQTRAWKEGRLLGMTLFTSGGPGTLWDGFETSQPHMDTIADFVRNYMENVDKPPPPPPPPPATKLVNGSFEMGWTDQSMTAQEPHGWTLKIETEGEVRGRPINGTPECVHKLNSQLPPDEQIGGENALILDGVHVYKMFTRATWRASLRQKEVISGLEPGARATVTWPVQIHFDGRGDVYESDDTSLLIDVNGELTTFWMTKELDRQWIYIKAHGDIDANGELRIQGIASVAEKHDTAFFFDAITLEVDEPIPPDCKGLPRIPYSRSMLVVPQDATLQQWRAVCDEAFAHRQSVGFSYDDAGIGDLEAKEAILYGLNPADYPNFEAWYEQHYPGTAVEFRNYPGEVPVGVFIDVSHNNGTMDWSKAKANGVTHAYIKASDGPEWRDPQFATNWQGAKEQGIKRGAYHYYRNYADPTAQAMSFLEVVGDDLGEILPALDVEDDDSPVTGSDIWSWLLIVSEATGIDPAIYTAAWWWDQYMDGTSWATDYALWVANWTEADTPVIPKDWAGAGYWLWQYDNRGDGVRYGAQKLAIDLNRFA
jgi:lysozyme